MMNYSELYKLLRMSNLEIKVSFSKCILLVFYEQKTSSNKAYLAEQTWYITRA